jgi:hypothetical protein
MASTIIVKHNANKNTELIRLPSISERTQPKAFRFEAFRFANSTEPIAIAMVIKSLSI